MALSWLPRTTSAPCATSSITGIDRPFGIGAIADDVAEADDPLGALGARGLEACGKGLPVGVNVGKDGQPQGSSATITTGSFRT